MTEDPSAQRPPIPPYDPAATPAQQDARTGERPPARAHAAGLAAAEREQALRRLRQKRDFRTHLVVYALVMALLVAIWLITGGVGSFFWPIWPMLGWGLAVAIHGATLFSEQEPSEQQIAAEAARIRARRQRGRLEE